MSLKQEVKGFYQEKRSDVFLLGGGLQHFINFFPVNKQRPELFDEMPFSKIDWIYLSGGGVITYVGRLSTPPQVIITTTMTLCFSVFLWAAAFLEYFDEHQNLKHAHTNTKACLGTCTMAHKNITIQVFSLGCSCLLQTTSCHFNMASGTTTWFTKEHSE